MKLTFKNTSKDTVILSFENKEYTIPPFSQITAEGHKKEATFSVSPDKSSFISYLSSKTGIIRCRHFILNSSYVGVFDNDCLIQLVSNVRKGKFADEYERIVPFCAEGKLSKPFYKVKDEAVIRREIEDSITKGNRTVRLFDLLDILGNSLCAILLLIIPFVLIWIFGSFSLAATVCGYAFIPIFIIIVLINRFFDKLKRKAWKKGKSFVLKNQIFKDYKSYFDNDYITSIFER